MQKKSLQESLNKIQISLCWKDGGYTVSSKKKKSNKLLKEPEGRLKHHWSNIARKYSKIPVEDAFLS